MSTRRYASIARSLENWFAENQRDLPWRDRYDPYHILVSEMMLQQTRMEVVLEYFPRFIARFPTLAALAAATEEQVLAAWSGLGYYRRARMLHACAVAVTSDHGGILPSNAEALAALPGIGRYTAGAVTSIAFDLRAPVVEGNVMRLLSRVEALDAPLGSAASTRALWEVAEALVELATSPRALNQALMEFGSLVCRPRNPRCNECALSRSCKGSELALAGELPRRREAVEPQRMSIALYLVTDGAGRVLMRRERGALMREMFHLPHGDTSLLSGDVLAVRRGARFGSFVHTVTKRRIEFELFAGELHGDDIRESADEYRWIDPCELAQVPHPSYVKKALQIAQGCRLKATPRAHRSGGT